MGSDHVDRRGGEKGHEAGMNLSLYRDGRTWIHRLDGRTKVISVTALFMLEVLFSNPWYLFIMIGLTGVGIWAAGAWENIKKLWFLLVLLFVYSVLLWPFFVEGHIPVFRIGEVVVTQEGLVYGIGMGLRLDAMLMSGLLLLSTTTIEDFSRSLQRLGIPSSLGFAFSLAFRWVQTLLGSMGTIVQAQRSRGLDLTSGSFLGKIRRYPPLVVPLIGHTLRQTNLLAMALESKGFGPGQLRPHYVCSRFAGHDYLLLVWVTIVIVVSLWFRWKGYGTI